MSLAQMLQLYAPLAGLLAVFFWLGVLSNRVKALEDKRKDDHDGAERVIRLDEQMKGVRNSLESIDRHIAGIQRQLAQIQTGRAGGPMLEIPGGQQ